MRRSNANRDCEAIVHGTVRYIAWRNRNCKRLIEISVDANKIAQGFGTWNGRLVSPYMRQSQLLRTRQTPGCIEIAEKSSAGR